VGVMATLFYARKFRTQPCVIA